MRQEEAAHAEAIVADGHRQRRGASADIGRARRRPTAPSWRPTTPRGVPGVADARHADAVAGARARRAGRSCCRRYRDGDVAPRRARPAPTAAPGRARRRAPARRTARRGPDRWRSSGSRAATRDRRRLVGRLATTRPRASTSLTSARSPTTRTSWPSSVADRLVASRRWGRFDRDRDAPDLRRRDHAVPLFRITDVWPTATCPAASTTPLRPASRPSPSRRSSPRSRTTTTPTSAPARSSSRSSAPSWSSTTSGCCGPTTSRRRTSRSTPSCTPCSTRPPSSPAPPAPRVSSTPAKADELLAKIDEIAAHLRRDQEGLIPGSTARKGRPGTSRGALRRVRRLRAAGTVTT